ncbi:GtrA family protein [Stenotrophomonas mori]|uniref:GtrA family protein n=1 Tax=Stenotrophomonas mori TaxID=2871096 RepID=A0ABT0SJV4_9GAMM|nr:GtrA family protein [Stenotrophomonas mori]MCL7715265.1 GtrA family protein [Stenotrophomonas mori]
MTLTRQGALFLLMGGLQWVLDWLLTVALSHAGAPLEVANICGRIGGALLGFWLNGTVTFPAARRLGRTQLQRFAIAWTVLTVVSTVAVGQVGHSAGLEAAWLAKAVIEAALAVVSFFVSRHWIYR